MRYSSLFFDYSDTAPSYIYTLSLHDALPIYPLLGDHHQLVVLEHLLQGDDIAGLVGALERDRSEEHTSELQSRQYLVCRLLLEKKKATSHSHCAGPTSPRPRCSRSPAWPVRS